MENQNNVAYTNGQGSNPLTDNQLRRMEEIVGNMLSARSDFFKKLFDPRRNLDDECGYPSETSPVSVERYRLLYEREPIAARVVQVLSKESWQVQPLVYESDSSDEITQFESTWDDLSQQLHGENSRYQDESGSPIWEYLQRADELSGIGHFGILLLGIDDGLQLYEPIENVVNPKLKKPGDKQGKAYSSTDSSLLGTDAQYQPIRFSYGPSIGTGGSPDIAQGADQQVRQQDQPVLPGRPQPRGVQPPSGLPTVDLKKKKQPFQTLPIGNAFCATGEGGGIDASCSPGGGSGAYSNLQLDMKMPYGTKEQRQSGKLDVYKNSSKGQLKNLLKNIDSDEVSLKGMVDFDGNSYVWEVPRGSEGVNHDRLAEHLGVTVGHSMKFYVDKGKDGQPIASTHAGIAASARVKEWADKMGMVANWVGNAFPPQFLKKRGAAPDSSGQEDPTGGGQAPLPSKPGQPPPNGKAPPFGQNGKPPIPGQPGQAPPNGKLPLGPNGKPILPSEQNKQHKPPPYEGEFKLLFLRAFDESLVQITQYESDPTNPRFGQPVMYNVTLNDPREQHTGIGLPLNTVKVHWSRVIHLADNRGSSEVFGVPRMRPVLNPLLDIRKVRGASAEGYWKSCFAALSLETQPNALGGDVSIDKTAVRDMMENFGNGLQRYLTLFGLSAKTLAPQVIDPTPHVEVQINAICIQLGIPVRVFKGSERGELASSQDDSAWNDRLRFRQNGYLTPKVIVPFIDRLIAIGILPDIEGYSVEWPDLDSLSEKDKAAILFQRTGAYAAYAAGGLESIIPTLDYMTKFDDMDEEEAAAIADSAAQAEIEKEQENQALIAEHGMVPDGKGGVMQPPQPPVIGGGPPGGGPPGAQMGGTPPTGLGKAKMPAVPTGLPPGAKAGAPAGAGRPNPFAKKKAF